MPAEKITNLLLYVPFNDDNSVDKNVKDLLTEKEFFEKCYLKPNFDKEIEEIFAKSSDEIEAFEIDITKDELIRKYERKKSEEEALFNWINANENNLYCIKGDAGTGKTTFLHYLKYKYMKTDLVWNIIDIQRAINSISILGNDIDIPKFNSLYNKAISAIIICIKESLFYFDSSNQLIVEESLKKIERVSSNYKILFEKYYPNRTVKTFFENLFKLLNSSEKGRSVCESVGQYCADYFNGLYEMHKGKYNILFKVYVELYIFFLRCENLEVRHMIAFDNFERFIGTEEIYSGQLTEFVGELRNIQNSIAENYPYLSNYYQILIFMRNTSVRMFTPLQIADFFPHYLDLSEWFQVSKIVEKKIAWYRENNIKIDVTKRLEEILNDIGGCENSFRGLRSKLNMLFNNNKRVIIKFLTKIISSSANKKYLEKYDFFWNNQCNIEPSYARFAARTIIFRLVLNELRSDGFFRHIITQRSDNEKKSLGYARKILSILYEHKLQNNDDYMDFVDIIRQLYCHEETPESKYFNSNNNKKRLTIAQILFYMNYYDTRTDNWLQFIDIQYNIQHLGRIRIQGYEELKELIDGYYKDIKVKITSAGVAYLHYVVYYFEYFSCKSIYVERKRREFGNDDLPPLLCAIPSEDEIRNNVIDSLPCMKIINIVSLEARDCIKNMNEDKNSILFRNNLGEQYIYHKNRIINSHTGYLNNFLYCLRSIYAHKLDTDIQLSNKYREIKSRIESIRDSYLDYV